MKSKLRYTGLGAIILLVFIITLGVYQESSKANDHAPVLSPYIPDSVNFCDELVPIHQFDIFESLERELIVSTYFHSQTVLFLKKSERYFPIIEPILKEYNIPDDFKYLAVAESGLANVVSPSGAKGFWQILEGTATDYGLEVNNEVDERYHLEKATAAACKFLLESYAKYQNWTLVAASYNAGRRGIDRQISRQGENNYYDLLLTEETARYVFRILAIKTILEKPEMYGFNVPTEERYQKIPYSIVKVREPIENLAAFAQEHNTNYKILKYLNPWLRENKLTNATDKEYKIKIPKSRIKNAGYRSILW